VVANEVVDFFFSRSAAVRIRSISSYFEIYSDRSAGFFTLWNIRRKPGKTFAGETGILFFLINAVDRFFFNLLESFGDPCSEVLEIGVQPRFR
jgi:hypothetical protein